MKIHNKKKLILSILYFVFAVTCIIPLPGSGLHDEPIAGYILGAMLLFAGGTGILQSLSEEENAESTDERSQMIRHKAEAKAADLLQQITTIATVLFIATYLFQSAELNNAWWLGIIRIVLASLFCFSSLFGLLVMGAKLYYEKRM